MSNHVETFTKSIGERWKSEMLDFRDSRKELLQTREFKIALFYTLTPILSLPFFALLGMNNGFIILLMFAVVFCMYSWLVGLGFITVGSVLFDNIPIVSDVSSIIDIADGLGFHKIKHVSTVLKKKEHLEDKVTEFLREKLMFITITIFCKAKWMMRESFSLIRHGYFMEGFLHLFSAVFVFFIPICCISFIGFFGLLTNLRISIARIPLLLTAIAYFFIIMTIMSSFNISNSPAFGLILMSLFTSGYTFFFAEQNELLMIKGIFRYIAEETKAE